MLLPGPNAVSLAVTFERVTGVLNDVVSLSSRAIGGVGRFVGVLVGVFVGVLVDVFVGVLVGVMMGVSVGAPVAVFVGVLVWVSVGVLVAVFVGVDVGARMVTVSELALFVSLASVTLLFGSTVAVLERLPAEPGATVNVTRNEAPAERLTGPLALQLNAVPVMEQLIVPVGVVPPLVTVSAPCG